MYNEDDLLPISALSQLIFCERRAAMMHIERIWKDNSFTVEGEYLHSNVDEDGRRIESRKNMRIARALALRSLKLGLTGISDVVEYHKAEVKTCARTKGARKSKWLPFPVEYKRGKPKPDESDKVQLCAQALCLEEMHSCEVPCGALYYHQTRKRLEVVFDLELRKFTIEAATRLHTLISSGKTPLATPTAKCRGCSLVEECMPNMADGSRSASKYLERILEKG